MIDSILFSREIMQRFIIFLQSSSGRLNLRLAAIPRATLHSTTRPSATNTVLYLGFFPIALTSRSLNVHRRKPHPASVITMTSPSSSRTPGLPVRSLSDFVHLASLSTNGTFVNDEKVGLLPHWLDEWIVQHPVQEKESVSL